MVFQNYALYPHMTRLRELAYGPKIAKVPMDEIKARVAKAAKILEPALYLQRKPRELRAGSASASPWAAPSCASPGLPVRRTALQPRRQAARQHRLEIQKLHRDLGITSLFVTHDQVEAMTLAQRMIVMNGGIMEQFGTPEEVYTRPASTFVASFIGSPPMNPAKERADALPGTITGIRPEHLAITETGWALRVDALEMLGAEQLVWPLAARQRRRSGDRPLRRRPPGTRARQHDSRHAACGSLPSFDAATGRRL